MTLLTIFTAFKTMLWCDIVDSLPVGITAITVALWSAESGLELSSLVATVDGGLVYDTVVSVNALAAHTEQIVPGRSALTNMPVRNLSRPAIFRGEAVGLRRDRRNKLHFNRLGTTSISNPSLYIASLVPQNQFSSETKAAMSVMLSISASYLPGSGQTCCFPS